ncbi:MAG TPA: PhoH family protein [Bacilli bacterium]|nr:PhoH family protein [Bacilli bacterium]
MGKVYVLDTNVLLQDPHSLFSFQENEVVIPAIVLEEVDSKKRYMDEIGRNARKVSKMMDSLRERGKLHEGVGVKKNGKIRVELNHRSFHMFKDTFVEMTNDNRILAVALNLKLEEEKVQGRQVILVSKDALLRVKADALGIRAEDYLSDRIMNDDDDYTGCLEVFVETDILSRFYEEQELNIKEITSSICYPHQFIIMKDMLKGSGSAIGKVDVTGKKVRRFKAEHDQVWGITPRNLQQKMALELLIRQDIPLVTLIGKAGTGKTLLSLAAGLFLTEEQNVYKKLVVAKPIIPVGKDIGYLPGEKEEKMRPWMQPIYDNLEYLFNVKKQGELDRILAGMSGIQVEVLTYIRGRSIPNQFIIIDEAQNLTKHEVKTILTRVGEGSKIILMGDPQQIDHPYLDERNNGLMHVVESFKNEQISGHIKLEKGERSKLAQIAADLL